MTKQVKDVAKELNIKTDELITKLKDLGVEAKDDSFALDKKTIELITQDLNPPEKEKEEEKTDKSSEKKLEIIEIVEGSTVKEFAHTLAKDPAEIIQMLFKLGEMVTINQPLSEEEIIIVSEEVGFEAKIISGEEEEDKELEEVVIEGETKPRPPVVTIMGHVDHGKTLLLDSIRKTNVVSTEAGGITQHIGAYQVDHDKKDITFIDTPGHEAFTAMRARGAEITDIAILVVAADDGVKPQTIEAMDHAKAAQVPIIVAVNKIDKPEAKPEKVRQELSQYELTPEEWGGETIFVDVSAKKNQNIDNLLEMILLVAEVQELKAVPKGNAYGNVIESRIDKGRGPVATVLIKHGTLKIGDSFVAGMASGRVRALFDDQGNKVKEATPAQPIEILGFNSTPKAGDIFRVVETDKEAREIAEKRALKQRLLEEKKKSHLTLEDLHRQIEDGNIKELNLIVKADVQGSIEALRDSLAKIDKEEVRIKVIHTGVGAVIETDIMLASASNAIVIGFNVRPDAKARDLAEKEKVDVRTYKVIYQVVEDISSARKGLLAPRIEEEIQGEAQVLEIFKVPKIGVISGCKVNNGFVNRNSNIRVIRDGVVIQETKIASLRRFKNDVNEVKEGYECGIGLENFQDLKQGDILETYIEVEKPRE